MLNFLKFYLGIGVLWALYVRFIGAGVPMEVGNYLWAILGWPITLVEHFDTLWHWSL